MPDDRDSSEWRAGYRDAEEQVLEASLSVTASERLRWLEEALAFAAQVGALPRRDAGDSQGEEEKATTNRPR